MNHPKQPYLETPTRDLIRPEPNWLRLKQNELQWHEDVASTLENISLHPQFRANTVWGDLLIRAQKQLHAHMHGVEREIENLEEEAARNAGTHCH